MVCKKCGNELPENQEICPSCGENNSVEQLDLDYDNVEVLDEPVKDDLIVKQDKIVISEKENLENIKNSETTLSVSELMNIKNKKLPVYTEMDFVNNEEDNKIGNDFAGLNNGPESNQLTNMLALESPEEKKRKIRNKKISKIVLIAIVILSIGGFIFLKNSDSIVKDKKVEKKVELKDITIGSINSKIPKGYEYENKDNSTLIKDNGFSLYLYCTPGDYDSFSDNIDEMKEVLTDYLGKEVEYDESSTINGVTTQLFYIPEDQLRFFIVKVDKYYYLQGLIKVNSSSEMNSVLNLISIIVKNGKSTNEGNDNLDDHYEFIPNFVEEELFN